MYVKRYLLLALAAIVPVTWGMMAFYPEMNFVQYVLPVMGAGFVLMLALAGISVFKEEGLDDRGKSVLMALFLVVILVPTVFAIGSYVHRTMTSWSGGELHYHADYEVVVQTDEGYRTLDLVDPSEFCKRTRHESTYMCRLNDRTGSTAYHEHDDGRIHLEGTFRQREDATLAAYFETFAGELSNTRLVYPTNEKTWNLTEDGRSLKIIVKRGVGGSRGYCVIGEDVPREEICRNAARYGGGLATRPSEYVISPWQQAQNRVTLAPLDQIWIIYDNRTTMEALRDLRQDDSYKQFSITKTSEGY
ncbi:MAG: hypothetical protein SVU32_08715 [Candidatus Nanohaloarchaea archaeon]|nr:hypothetical protein [Candidatus Nanohaloarchaea archaeon]